MNFLSWGGGGDFLPFFLLSSLFRRQEPTAISVKERIPGYFLALLSFSPHSRLPRSLQKENFHPQKRKKSPPPGDSRPGRGDFSQNIGRFFSFIPTRALERRPSREKNQVCCNKILSFAQTCRLVSHFRKGPVLPPASADSSTPPSLSQTDKSSFLQKIPGNHFFNRMRRQGMSAGLKGHQQVLPRSIAAVHIDVQFI